ncbi:hypothetical protein D3C87_1366150 [compost metagenome]
METFCFPRLLGRAEHGALAATGIANHQGQIAASSHDLQCIQLFARNVQTARLHSFDRLLDALTGDVVPDGLEHTRSGLLQLLLNSQHVPASKPVAPLAILAEGDQIG